MIIVIQNGYRTVIDYYLGDCIRCGCKIQATVDELTPLPEVDMPNHQGRPTHKLERCPSCDSADVWMRPIERKIEIPIPPSKK